MQSIRFILLVALVLLLPVPSFASILIPNGNDFAAMMYLPLVVYYNVFVLIIVFISRLLRKEMPMYIPMGIAAMPSLFALVTMVIPTIYRTYTQVSYPGDVEYMLSFITPIIALCVFQLVVIWIALLVLFYRPLLSNKVKLVGILGIAALVAFFIPKHLYAIRDNGLYFANEKPLKCSCLGVSAGEPGAIGYYCFGMPLSCVETERVGMPLDIRPTTD